jgi:hypothetical protein
MDCLEDFIDSLINIRLDHLSTYTIESRWIVLALATIVAFSVAYYYVLSGREAPVHYDVPLPPEIRAGWEAQSFGDLNSEDRKILESQIQGVRPYSFKTDRSNWFYPLCFLYQEKSGTKTL